MANIKSSAKRHRQSLKLRTQNRQVRSEIGTATKRALEFSKQGRPKEALETARLVTSLLDKAAIHGVVHKKNAQRNISRLHRQIAAKTAS